jgi:pimeloyl-ACP methyl ester carboxylesterase
MLSHEVDGRGEPLVLVHGLTHRRQGWYRLLDHLTPHRTVVPLDLPGPGESPALVVRDGDVQMTQLIAKVVLEGTVSSRQEAVSSTPGFSTALGSRPGRCR